MLYKRSQPLTITPKKACKSSLAIFVLLLLFIAAPSNTWATTDVQAETAKRVFELMNMGRKATANKQYEEAITYYRAALEFSPDYAEPYFRIGVAYVRLNQMSEGIAAVVKSLEIQPNIAPARFALANLYRLDKQLTKSIEQLSYIVENAQNPKDKRKAEYLRYQVYLELKEKIKKEEEELAKIVNQAKQSPTNIELQFKLADAYIQRKKFKNSFAVFEYILTLDESNTLATLRLAEQYIRDKKLDSVFSTLTQVFNLKATGVVLRNAIDLSLATVNSLKGKFPQRSIDLLKLVIEADDTIVSAHSNIGILYQQTGVDDLALKHLMEATKLDPKNPLIFANIASFYLDFGQPELAMKALQKSLDLKESSPDIMMPSKTLVTLYLKLGGALIKKGQMGQAKQAFSFAIEADPENTKTLTAIALEYFAVNATELARQHLESVISLKPDSPQANYYLGIIYADSGEFDKAIVAYSNLIASSVNSEELSSEKIANKLALVIAKKAFTEGHTQRAEDILSNYIIQRPDDVEGYFYLAMIYDRSQRILEATKAYEEVIRLNPSHQASRMELGRLYEQQWAEEDALAQYNQITRGQESALTQEAERRQQALSRQINGMSYGLSQSFSFDNNANLSELYPTFGYRTSLNFNASYRYKIRHNIRFLISVSPSYSGYVTNASDIFSLPFSPSITFGNGEEGIELGYSNSTSSGFIGSEDKVSKSIRGNIEYRKNIYPLFHFGKEQPKKSWKLRSSYSFSDYISFTNPSLNTSSHTMQLFMNYPTLAGRVVNLGYGLTLARNKNEAGNDYENNQHSLSVGISQRVLRSFSADLRYNLTLTRYINPDSHTNYAIYRRSLMNSISMSVNYSYSSALGFFGGYTWTHNRSNLPRGLVETDEGSIMQSASLGSYSSQQLSIGARINF